MNKKLFIIFFLACIIRLIGLDQSLWLDEATTANVVKDYSYLGIINKFSPTDFHPPLYYLSMKFWTNFFGYSEIVLRLPSLIFSLLTGWVVYLIGKKLRNKQTGFFAAVFFLFNPLIVYYSQEARMYMMVTFLLTAGFYFYLIIVTEHYSVTIKDKFFSFNLLMFNLLFCLSLYTFYGSIFFLATLFIYLLIKKQYKLFFILLLTFNFALLALFPLFFQQLTNAKKALQIVPNWYQVLGQVNIKNLLLIPIKFTSGRISFYPKIIYYLISGVWAVWVVRAVIIGSIKNKKLLLFLILPIILGLAFSFFSSLLQYFRFLYLIPIMCLLIAFGMNKNWQRYLLTSGFIIFSLIYVLIPSFHREDWKSLASALPSDKKILMILSSSDPIKYYRSDLKIQDLRTINNLKTKDKEIVVIPYNAEIYGLNYQTQLINKGLELDNKKTFRELSFEFWSHGINTQ